MKSLNDMTDQELEKILLTVDARFENYKRAALVLKARKLIERLVKDDIEKRCSMDIYPPEVE